MNRYIASVVGLTILFYANFSEAQTRLVPDVSGWNITNMSRVELRISDYVSVYIGFETEYSNPGDPREFVRVVSRHISLPIIKHKPHNQRLLSETSTALILQKEEQDLLKERSKQADNILYVHWRTMKDIRTGLDMSEGDVTIWLMMPNGEWAFVQNEKVEVEFLTENIGNGKPHNVFSGRKYRVGNFYHIMRADRKDIIKSLEGGK